MKVNFKTKTEKDIERGSILRIQDMKFGGEVIAIVIETSGSYRLLDMERSSLIIETDECKDIQGSTISGLINIMDAEGLSIIEVFDNGDFELNQIN